jgi:hypothetical protein
MRALVVRRRLAIRFMGALAFVSISGASASAQLTRPRAPVLRRPCDGDTITVVTVRSHPPAYSGAAAEAEQASFRFLGLPYVPTRPAVIAAYLRVAGGRVCSEFDRSESERLLRAQSFISSATVAVIPVSPGHSRVQVDVVDEVPVIVGARVSRGTVSSFLLGSQNVSGRGLTVAVSGERGFVYRNGLGLRVVKYGMFGRPDFLALVAERNPVADDRLSLELAEPFLTDLQKSAYHASASLVSGYFSVVRPTGDNVSLFLRRTTYDFGWVRRVRGAGGQGTVGLVGVALLGEDIRTGLSPVIVTDTGLVAGPVDAFGAGYPTYAITRAAVIGGLRSLRFETVRGFDALAAEQDLGVGVQFDVLVAPAVSGSGAAGDVLLATDLYSGVGDAQSFWVARALAEARGNRAAHRWDGLVSSARLAWYGNDADTRTSLASVELSSVQHLDFPLQLTFRDADGGLPGFGSATYAGGQRIIARAEERYLLHTVGTRADVAFAAFASAGKLWAGDVPYGRTTDIHASAGVSLLAAYPSGNKRTYRVDLAFPFNPEHGGSRVEVRFSATDRTRLLWLEPGDVARARTGAVPAGLMKW